MMSYQEKFRTVFVLALLNSWKGAIFISGDMIKRVILPGKGKG
jgi:hypothetical protein